MFFLNLSLPEFLALLSAISGVVVALYLLSRSRRRQKVPTLRFWTQAAQPVPSTRRRRIQQPLSLLLQLISLALLLLALAQLKWGDRERSSRDHVLLLDASSWTGARIGDKTIADDVRARARQYVRSLPTSDRVMVVRADGLPSPVTGMEGDRGVVEKAIDETRPGASALDLNAAFAFAAQTRQLNRSTAGEIVFVGASRLGSAGLPSTPPANVRMLLIDTPAENVGLTNIGVRRSDSNPEAWDVLLAVRNYSSTVRRVPVSVTFGGAPAGGTVLNVKPASTENYSFQLRTKAAGWIDARVMVRDALVEDNRAILELPQLTTLRVSVFTSDPDALRPALTAHGQIQATYLAPSAWTTDVQADVVVLDRFNPPSAPKVPAIWLEPPDGSPFRVRSRITGPKAISWRADHEIAAGIRARDLRLSEGQVFATAPDDVAIATVDAGPVAVLRAKDRSVALGFHPGRADMKFDLTTPLFFANVLRWMQPEVFRGAELHAGSVGTVTLPLQGEIDPKQTKVLADSTELPYTIHNGTLRFFAGSPGIVRVLTGGREQVYSLSLPEVGDTVWTPPSTVRTGMPSMFEQAVSRDLWQILAILGTFGLLAEWWIYGRRRVVAPSANGRSAAPETSTWKQAS